MRKFKIDWVHNGADIESSELTQGIPDDVPAVLAQLRARPTFLMVGTIKPRKGHAQVLDTFEKLWRERIEAHLAIAGKPGWKVEALTARLRSHPELGDACFG